MVYNHAATDRDCDQVVSALVAQLDRVLASEAKGRGFESRRARQISREPVAGLHPGVTADRRLPGTQAKKSPLGIERANYKSKPEEEEGVLTFRVGHLTLGHLRTSDDAIIRT